MAKELVFYAFCLTVFIEKERGKVQDASSRITIVLVRFGCLSDCLGVLTGRIITFIEAD